MNRRRLTILRSHQVIDREACIAIERWLPLFCLHPLTQRILQPYWAYLRLGSTLTNNETFQLIHSTFDLNIEAVLDIFNLADFQATQEQVTAWLNHEGDESFVEMNGTELALFLNGFINLKRGKRDGEQAKPEAHLNNNMVFQKLRIALNLKSEDILDVFQLADIQFSKHEISAFFRKPNNKHYRECTDKTFKKFLQGIHSQLRPEDID